MSSPLAGTKITDSKDADVNHNDLHFWQKTIVL